MSETAERTSSARAEAVLRLAWLSPSAASLAVLGRAPSAATWPAVRHDPGAVLLVVRHSEVAWPGRSSSAPPPSFCAAAFEQAALLEDALRRLDQCDGFVDWNSRSVQPVYDACLTFARIARRFAERTGQCDPEAAWTCGLLAPLGWLAMCAIDPDAVAACLADPRLRSDPAQTQRDHWGIDAAAIARRLARRWGLPAWATAAAEHFHLPGALAQTFRADPVLFPLTRLAVEEARRQGVDLGLSAGAFGAEDRAALLIPQGLELDGGRAETAALSVWQEPRDVPLLRDLLESAAENRRLREQPLHDHLEHEIDALHRALEEQVHGEAQRLQAGKLSALAEFAAGAGHEVNNPLAVISGQAQYLLGHESDWFRDAEGAARKALEAIVAQTRRIHGILRDLMQFAKPAPPCPGWIDLPALLGEVASSLGEAAAQRRIRIEVAVQPDRLPVYADAGQLRTALACLVRNALEAAPTDGWTRLVLRRPADGESIEVHVEDSGPGPEPGQRPHLFDPFFSGRTAGRGRGLGLPIAWRLAHLQGGDVRLDPPRRHEPTRFVLTLPRLAKPELECADLALLPLACAGHGRHAS